MNVAIFEDSGWKDLLPLTWLRPAFDLRCGMERLVDRQASQAPGPVCRMLLRPEIAAAHRDQIHLARPEPGADWLLLNARLWPSAPIPALPVGHAWTCGSRLISACVSEAEAAALADDFFLSDERVSDFIKPFIVSNAPASTIDSEVWHTLINFPWDLLARNGLALRSQLQFGGVREGVVSSGVHLLNEKHIHVARGAVLKPGVVVDAEEGPVHIAEGALLEPNAVIQGPAYIGPAAIIRPNAIIRPDTSIGPVSRVGGEIAESIIWGYSNKQHDGFLGHSYVGAWVNIGAGSTTSDLKNTYGTIRVFLNGKPAETGQQFLGAIIGDHSKLGICSMLPTGCIVGAASNVFLSGQSPKYVPSFAWCTDTGSVPYQLDRAVAVARAVMQRRKIHMSAANEALLTWAAWMAPQCEAAGWELLARGRS